MSAKLIKSFMVVFILLFSLGCDDEAEPEVIPLVALGESFYLEPGESVMFNEPIPKTFTLLRFEETEKFEGYYPYADFWYTLFSKNTSTESISRIQQSNIPEETPFFSACFSKFSFQDERAPIDMRWIVEEVTYEEFEDRFVFKGVRMRFYLEADVMDQECK